MRNWMISLILMIVILCSSFLLVKAQSGPTAEAFASEASAAFLSGDFENSINLYGQALALEPNHAGYLLAYVRALVYGSYTSQQDHYRVELALSVIEAAVERKPDDARIQAAYALALIENDRMADAVQAALKAIELDRDLAVAYAYLSSAQRSLAQWPEAEKSANEGAVLDPENLDVIRSQAASRSVAGDWREAIELYQQAIDLYPDFDFLYFEQAPFFIVQEDYVSALANYEAILQRQPHNGKAWLRICETYFRQHEDERAQAACEQALEIDPSNPDIHRQMGMLLYSQRNYEQAIEFFGQCVSLMVDQDWPLPDHNAECYYLQGISYSLLDQCDAAVPLFEQALALDTTEHANEIIVEGQQLCHPPE